MRPIDGTGHHPDKYQPGEDLANLPALAIKALIATVRLQVRLQVALERIAELEAEAASRDA